MRRATCKPTEKRQGTGTVELEPLVSRGCGGEGNSKEEEEENPQ